MGRISQKQRVSHCNTLEKMLPTSWKNFACEIEECVYKYYFSSDCREAYELKLQSLVHDLVHMPRISPKIINVLDLVKKSSHQLIDFEKECKTTVSTVVSSTVSMTTSMEYESIIDAQIEAKNVKSVEKEIKGTKEIVDELKLDLEEVIGKDESFFPCKFGCVVEKAGQVKIIDEKQTRRADEPMTLWLYCSSCTESWKQN